MEYSAAHYHHIDRGQCYPSLGPEFLRTADTDEQLPDPVEPVQQPASLIGVELFPFQRKTLYYAKQLENSSKEPIRKRIVTQEGREMTYDLSSQIGILGETTGAGKSIMMLGIILSDPMCIGEYNGNYSVLDCDRISLRTQYQVRIISGHNLIVIPHDLFTQWSRYIANHVAPTMARHLIRMSGAMEEVFRCIMNDIHGQSIILVTNLRYIEFMAEARRLGIKFARIIYDEADTINLQRSVSEPVDASFTWLMTANIHHFKPRNSGHLYNLFNDLCHVRGLYLTRKRDTLAPRREFARQIYQHLVLRNPPEIVEATFRLPAPNVRTIYSKEEKTLRVLRDIIPPDMKELISAGNFQAAAELMGMKAESADSLITHITSDMEKKIRNLRRDLESAERKEYDTEAKRNEAIQTIANNIRKLEEKINGIKSRLDADNIDPITLEEIVQPVILPCCHNKMEMSTIMEWLEKHATCPMCRQKVNPREMIFVGEQRQPAAAEAAAAAGAEEAKGQDEYNPAEHTKEENLLWMIQTNFTLNRDTRILLYMKNGHISHETYAMLATMGLIVYETQNSNFAGKIAEFRAGRINMLILNSNAMGTGFNMEFVTDLILYHHLNEHSLEQQVIGRAQRPGRNSQLRIWRLLNVGEV